MNDYEAQGRMYERATRLLLIALILAGVAARLYDLGYPNGLTWDEHHFVKNARNYLGGRADWNDHPPLGKLLLAVGITAFGDHGLGWRVVPLAFGVLLIGLALALATSAFRSIAAGLYAAAFVAVSGFAIAFSKTALLDGMLATSMVAAALVMWRARSWLGLSFAGALVGAAASIKFTGVVLCLPLALLTFRRIADWRKAVGVWMLAMASMLTVYVGQFSYGLSLAGAEHGVLDVFRKTGALLDHHIGLDDWEHGATSRWYTWFVSLKPITLFSERQGDVVRAMTTRDSPILWWGVNLAVLWSAGGLALKWRRWRRGVEGGAPGWRPGQAYLLLLWFLPLCPWIFTNRDSYIYHYLPSYVFGLVLFGGLASMLPNPRLRLALVSLIAAVFVFCVRVWVKVPIDAGSLLHRLFF